jgi:hypothetical protein
MGFRARMTILARMAMIPMTRRISSNVKPDFCVFLADMEK